MNGSLLAAASPRPALHSRLRRCGCESTCSPNGPRPAAGSGVGRVLGAWFGGTQDAALVCEGSKDAAFATGSRHQRSIVRASAREGRILRPPGRRCAADGQRFFLCVGRSTRRENPCPYGHLFVATILPSRGTVHAKEESCVDPAQMENRGRAPQTHPDRDPPLRSRTFRRPPRLEATATQHRARTPPRPADPADSRPTAQVETLSETTPTRSPSDAAAGEAPPPATQHHPKAHCSGAAACAKRQSRVRQPGPPRAPSAAQNAPQDAAELSADPLVHSLQSTFQSVQPLLSSRDRGLFTKRTTSPRRERS